MQHLPPTMDTGQPEPATAAPAGTRAQTEAPDARRSPTRDPVRALMLVDEPFTLNELQAMRLRGVLREVLPGAYLPASIQDTSSSRAKVAAGVAGEHLGVHSALCRRTAAWVYGCAPMPGEIEIVVPRYHRPCPPTARMILRMSEGIIDEEQICTLGGVNVTSPLRTAVDVAFNSELLPAVSILRAINGSARLGCSYGQMLERVEASVRKPGKLRALALIRRLLEEEPPDADAANAAAA